MSSTAPQAHLDPAGEALDDPPAFLPWDRSYCCLQVRDNLGVVAIHPVLKVSPHIKIWEFKSGECGDHCGSHLRLISRSGKRCCSHANDSFEVWGVVPSCWNHWRTLTTLLCRPSAVQNLPSTWTYRSTLIVTDRLIPSSWLRLRTDLLGLWTTESLTVASNVVWCPWWFRLSSVWLSVSVFTIEVMHSSIGSELVDPSVDHWVDRKFTTSELFFELQLSCVDRLLPKICLNYKYLLLSSPWHLEGQIW